MAIPGGRSSNSRRQRSLPVVEGQRANGVVVTPDVDGSVGDHGRREGVPRYLGPPLFAPIAERQATDHARAIPATGNDGDGPVTDCDAVLALRRFNRPPLLAVGQRVGANRRPTGVLTGLSVDGASERNDDGVVDDGRFTGTVVTDVHAPGWAPVGGGERRDLPLHAGDCPSVDNRQASPASSRPGATVTTRSGRRSRRGPRWRARRKQGARYSPR